MPSQEYIEFIDKSLEEFLLDIHFEMNVSMLLNKLCMPRTVRVVGEHRECFNHIFKCSYKAVLSSYLCASRRTDTYKISLCFVFQTKRFRVGIERRGGGKGLEWAGISHCMSV